MKVSIIRYLHQLHNVSYIFFFPVPCPVHHLSLAIGSRRQRGPTPSALSHVLLPTLIWSKRFDDVTLNGALPYEYLDLTDFQASACPILLDIQP